MEAYLTSQNDFLQSYSSTRHCWRVTFLSRFESSSRKLGTDILLKLVKNRRGLHKTLYTGRLNVLPTSGKARTSIISSSPVNPDKKHIFDNPFTACKVETRPDHFPDPIVGSNMGNTILDQGGRPYEPAVQNSELRRHASKLSEL